MQWVIPRLCRGDSRSLTFPGVSPGCPSMKLSVVSRQCTRKWSSAATAGAVPSGNRAIHLVRVLGVTGVRPAGASGRRYVASADERDEEVLWNCVGCQEREGYRSGQISLRRLQATSVAYNSGAASATPIAALSGANHKAPGFAGGYLLHYRILRTLNTDYPPEPSADRCSDSQPPAGWWRSRASIGCDLRNRSLTDIVAARDAALWFIALNTSR
jgi:hypothetical protein